MTNITLKKKKKKFENVLEMKLTTIHNVIIVNAETKGRERQLLSTYYYKLLSYECRSLPRNPSASAFFS